jgi:hypothetical protein
VLYIETIALVIIAIIAVTPIVTIGIPQLKRSRRGWVSLLLLAMVASAGGASSVTGDQTSFVGACAHFMTTVKTSEPSYARGQMVMITVTQANDGPACTIPPQLCGPPHASASADNVAGKHVWDAFARKRVTGTQMTCLGPGQVPRMLWKANESDIQKFDWNQDDCTEGAILPDHVNLGCPATQVPAGTYRITGEFYWLAWRFAGHGPPASATISITRKSRRGNRRSPGPGIPAG